MISQNPCATVDPERIRKAFQMGSRISDMPEEDRAIALKWFIHGMDSVGVVFDHKQGQAVFGEVK